MEENATRRRKASTGATFFAATAGIRRDVNVEWRDASASFTGAATSSVRSVSGMSRFQRATELKTKAKSSEKVVNCVANKYLQCLGSKPSAYE